MKNKWITLIVIVLVLLLIVSVFFIFKNKKDEKYIINSDEKWSRNIEDASLSKLRYHYYVNFKNNNIVKYEDKYNDDNEYEYKMKQIYDKKINEDYKQKLSTLLKTIVKESSPNNKNYDEGYYSIKSDYKKEITTNNNELKDLLVSIDND